MLKSQVSGVAIQLRLRYSQSLKPCELQKPIPNHQSSFCWICLPLLTRLTIWSSCPRSHHWISLGFHFDGLNPVSLVGLSRWPGEGRYPKHINWSLGFPRARFLDPSSSPHTLLGPIIQAHGFSYQCYADDTQLYLSFQPDDDEPVSNGSCTDLRLLGRHLGMDEKISPTTQLGKCNGCMPVRAVYKPHSPDLKKRRSSDWR